MKIQLCILLLGSLFLNACSGQLPFPGLVTFPLETALPRRVVFIAGTDEGDSHYYQNAERYFRTHDFQVIDSLHSLQEILSWLEQHGQEVAFDEIHLVSHSNPWRGMSLKIFPGRQRLTEKALAEALDNHLLPILQCAVSRYTRLIFHACGLADNHELLPLLQKAFTGDGAPRLFASPWYSVFDNHLALHYLARTYYTTYPTASDPGNMALAAKLQANYPSAAINWFSALQTTFPGKKGGQMAYQYNVPFEWLFSFADGEQAPTLKNAEEIMDFIAENDEPAAVLAKFNIPLEDFRWRAYRLGSQLKIEGKTTIVCILEPIMQADNPEEYQALDLCNADLFVTL